MSKSTKLCPLVGSGILYMEKTLKTILCLVLGFQGWKKSLGHFVFPFCTPNQKTFKYHVIQLSNRLCFFQTRSHFFIPMCLFSRLYLTMYGNPGNFLEMITMYGHGWETTWRGQQHLPWMCFFHVLRIVPYVNHHQTDPPFRGIPGFSHLVCKMCGFLFHPKKPNKRQKILHIWIFSRVCVIVSKNILSKGRFPSHVIVCRILHHLNGNINTYLAILHNLFDFQEGFFLLPSFPVPNKPLSFPGLKSWLPGSTPCWNFQWTSGARESAPRR